MFNEYPKMLIVDGKEIIVFSREEEDAASNQEPVKAQLSESMLLVEKKKRGRPPKVKDGD